MSLEPVGKLVAAHSSSPAAVETKIQQADAERALVQRMARWMMWGMLVLGIGVVMLVLNKSFAVGKWFQLLSAFFLLSGIGMASYGVLAAIRDGASLTGKSSPKSLTQAKPTKFLPPEPTPLTVASITERTTQLIPPEDLANRAND